MAGLDKETLDIGLASLDEFVKRHLPDELLLQLDRADEFPEQIIRAMCGEELGIQLFFIEEEYGGMGGGAFDLYRICERLAHVDIGVATGVLATHLGSEPVHVGATQEQKERWLGRIAEEGVLMAYGATEPAAGSDLGALRTVATPVRENGEVVGYRITGNKQWISNGGVADMFSILANAPGGPTWFVVKKGAEGFSAGKSEEKHGIRASNTSPLTLEDVYVPIEDLVGSEEGLGLRQALSVFGYTRMMVAAFGLGAGWAALDRAIPYSEERVQGGGPLSEKQGYTHKLIVPHAARLEAARAYIEEIAARLDDEGNELVVEGGVAKYLATEFGNAAADASIQALGGYGYVHEYMVEKIKRDVRITTIYEGTSEIMEMSIGRDRWQQHLKSRGKHYHELAEELERLHREAPQAGADTAALGLHALAEILERCRTQRLTRNQHVLFRLGELCAWGEGARAAARRAAAALTGKLHEKSPKRFDAATLAAMSRIYCREASRKISSDGLAWVCAADGAGDADLAVLEAALGTTKINAAQRGLIADMNAVADALYDRASAKTQAA